MLAHLGNWGLAVEGFNLPWAFAASTAALAAGCWGLHNALHFVRLEKQVFFRRNLLLALGAGTMFVGVQCYGLWCLAQGRAPGPDETGAVAFVFVLAALHGIHFSVALLFLVYVTLRGFADAYDHEYYWGVTVCAFFWHFLAGVWAFILLALGIIVLASH
jgi:cytochrome c oxidase subunit 3